MPLMLPSDCPKPFSTIDRTPPPKSSASMVSQPSTASRAASGRLPGTSPAPKSVSAPAARQPTARITVNIITIQILLIGIHSQHILYQRKEALHQRQQHKHRRSASRHFQS